MMIMVFVFNWQVSFIRWFHIIGQCNIFDLILVVPILLSEQDHFAHLKIWQCYSMARCLITLSTLSLIKCSGAAVWMYTQCTLHTPNQRQLSIVRCSGKIASLDIWQMYTKLKFTYKLSLVWEQLYF